MEINYAGLNPGHFENKIEKRLSSVKKWLSNNYNLALLGILILALVIRIYFFIKTAGQTLWWDEAEYMSTAVHFAFNVPYELNPQRLPLFHFLSAFIFKIGLGEQTIKFFLILLPSVFLVFAVYLLGKEMFNKKVGLISAFLTSVSWNFLFWTGRVQPDFLSMVFSVLAIWFMWMYWKGNNKIANNFWLVFLSGIFSSLGFYFKISGLFVPMIFAIFIFLKDRFSAFKNKYYYFYVLGFILLLIPYFIWSFINFGTPTGFTQGYVSEPVPKETPFGWYNLNFYSILTTSGLSPQQLFNLITEKISVGFFNSIFFILFILGVFYASKFILYIDILVKNKNKFFDPLIFSMLTLIFISVFYIFHIKNTDDRWVFMWLPFIFFLIGKSSLFLYNKLKKYNMIFALILIIGLLLLGGFSQYKHANSLTDIKKESYLPVKLAGEWMKQNSDKDDVLVSVSSTQGTYYSQRKTQNLMELGSYESLDNYILENKPKFLQVSAFEPHDQWIYEWIDFNQDKLISVYTSFADEKKTQPVLIVYEIKYFD